MNCKNGLWPSLIITIYMTITVLHTVISDAQLDTRAALNAHVGVGCVCAGRAYSTKLLPGMQGCKQTKRNTSHF